MFLARRQILYFVKSYLGFMGVVILSLFLIFQIAVGIPSPSIVFIPSELVITPSENNSRQDVFEVKVINHSSTEIKEAGACDMCSASGCVMTERIPLLISANSEGTISIKYKQGSDMNWKEIVHDVYIQHEGKIITRSIRLLNVRYNGDLSSEI